VRIGLVSTLVERTPPHRYGGTERVVAALADGLVRRGHAVTLFATGDSATAAELVPVVERPLWHNLDYRGEPTWPVARQLAMVAARQADFDIIHSHQDHQFLPLLFGLDTLAITTLHSRLDLVEYRDVLAAYSFAPLVSISDAQRVHVRDLQLNWLATVHNGLDPAPYTYSEKPGDYLVFLGRMSPEKGPEAAVRIAIEAGMPLRMAAKVPESDRAYFESVVAPLLKLPSIEFTGEVTAREKAALLAGAYALIFPADWPEPFGLSLIEAMASGTPQVALRRGAIPEIVEDGVTGFVCDTIGKMAAAVPRVAALDRAASRRRFLERFTTDVMVDRHVSVYEQALSSEPLPRVAARQLWEKDRA